MSDISKKIFSIEPEPDEDPIALVPEPPETDKDPTAKDSHSSKRETENTEGVKTPLLRTVVDIPAPLNRPIFELVEAIDEIEEDDTVERAVGPALNDTSEDDTDYDNSEDESEATTALSTDLTDEDGVDENFDTSNIETETQPDPVIRPLATRDTSREVKTPPAAPPIPTRDIPLQPAYIAPTTPSAARLGWVGPLLTLFTGLAIGAVVFAYTTETASISPFGLAALITAVIVPMISVLALWVTLRALATNRQETSRLAEVADRLTRADEAVTSDVSRMSSAIKRELAQVDSRLAQSRDELDTLVALISRQSTEMNGMTQKLTDRSETIAKTVTDQRDAFADLSSDFETRMTALRQSIETQREALNETTTVAAQRVDDASEALSHATKLTADHSHAIATAATTANSSITEAEGRLSALSDRITAQVDELDAFYKRRLTQLTDLSARLSDDKGLAETALYSQSEKLGAVDAQLEMTESRLTDLLDHAAQVQAQLTARLSDIDRTLSDADQRSRAFTADIADRVTDSVAQTRREISIMESELRALQSRMDGAKATDRLLPLSETPKAAPTRVHLKPLDTDFPSLDLDDLAIPEAMDHDDDATLDLIEAIDDEQFSPAALNPSTPPAEKDIVRRPGEDRQRVLSRGNSSSSDTSEKNWRWRDMLGSIDPIVDHDAPPQRSTPPPKSPTAVERPGPGVPLRTPISRATVRAPQPEGSDVVARLCEVKLAPSTVVDDVTIAEATSARQSGGEAAQSRSVFTRLNSPVIHLRGVLSADLEFRLRAEGFRRSYHSYLSEMNDASRLRAELASANGRAYLLCAAALSAS